MSNGFGRRRLARTALGALATIGGVAAWRSARAAALPAAAGKPILTVTGRIAATNGDGTATFDRAMLEQLGIDGFSTSTPWYPEPMRFEGVRMDHLMSVLGASGDAVIAYALNDYTTELPMSDFAHYNVILALKRNGEYMSVRDKGPLFVIYPFDSDSALRSQKYYSRSAWQVARMHVK